MRTGYSDQFFLWELGRAISSFFENWVQWPVLFMRTGSSDQFVFRKLGTVTSSFFENWVEYQFFFEKTSSFTQLFFWELAQLSKKRTGHQFPFFWTELDDEDQFRSLIWNCHTSRNYSLENFFFNFLFNRCWAITKFMWTSIYYQTRLLGWCRTRTSLLLYYSIFFLVSVFRRFLSSVFVLRLYMFMYYSIRVVFQ
jgi:hypothetical protein